MCGVPGLAPSVSITTLTHYFRGKFNYVLCHLFQFSMNVLGNASISSKNSVVNHGQHQNRLKWEMEMLTLAAEKTAEFGQNWKTIIFFFSLKKLKSSSEGELSSVTMCRISGKQWWSAVMMLSSWWVAARDLCSDIGLWVSDRAADKSRSLTFFILKQR